MPVQMTREQYNALYGVQPVFSNESSLDTTPAPVRMTQAEYDALYRQKDRTLLEKTGSVLKGETTSPAKLGGAETILPNIASYFKNIPSSAANLVRQTIAPINPLDIENPLNIGAALVRAKEGYKKELEGGVPTTEAQKNLALSPLKGAFSIWQGAGESIYKNLEQNALGSKTLAGGVALSAADATSKIAEMIINDPTLVPALLWAPEAVGAKADAISRTARPFIEAGKTGAKAFEPVLAKTSKLAEPITSRLPSLTSEARLENTITKIEEELFKIESNYSTTRKANEFISDAGSASRRRIANTDVLVGAVDNNGILRTKGAGNAIEKYRAQTVDGIESVVRDNLVREGKTANIAELGNKLKLAVYDSGLEGADLVKALNGIKKELQGLALRADEFGNLPLYRYHDAKIATTNGINYLTDSKPTVFYRKAKARAYKEFVEEKSAFNVKSVNQQLKKYYEDIALLERLDGKRVEGGRLGKYFASISGNIVGGATGAAIGGYTGAAVGSVLGGEAAQLIKGGMMSRTFGKARGLVAPENKILEEAKASAKLPPTKDLRVPDKAVGVPQGISKTKEITKLESQIKKNVEAQKAAIKAGDFTLVEALKEIYQVLVEKLKEAIKIAKIALKDQRGFIRLDGGQSKSLGSRNTTYSPTNSTSKKLIPKNVANTEQTSKAQVFEGFPDLTTKVLDNLKGKSTVSKQFISDLTNRPELKQPERDLIREVLSEFDAPKVSGVSDELIAEARKYKSAEEFKNFMRGSATQYRDYQPTLRAKYGLFEDSARISDLGVNPELKVTIYRGVPDPKTQKIVDGDFVTTDRLSAESYAGRENVVSKEVRAKDLIADTADEFDPQNPFLTGAEFVYSDSKNKLVNLTDKQLTDIYNQAHQTTDKIPVQEFADKVKARLLPLERTTVPTPRYESITLPADIRGNVANYSEHIYNQKFPLTNTDPIHFADINKRMFGWTRVEDMADGKTRRVIEVQNHLYQKGDVAQELKIFPSLTDAERKSIFNGKGTIEERNAEAATLQEMKRAEKQKLGQYNNPTAHFRKIREEIKQAAQDGKTKLQFPTGETAMKIEGLGQNENSFLIRNPNGVQGRDMMISLTQDKLKVGEQITDARITGGLDDWIITEVLGDGKFKAAPKNQILTREIEALQSGSKLPDRTEDIRKLESITETFDISGKVDTSNPIYKFYEKDVQKYLRNKYNAKVVTDEQGVQWVEMDVPKDANKIPVEAFGVLPFIVGAPFLSTE